jgi:hypothetical protein
MEYKRRNICRKYRNIVIWNIERWNIGRWNILNVEKRSSPFFLPQPPPQNKLVLDINHRNRTRQNHIHRGILIYRSGGTAGVRLYRRIPERSPNTVYRRRDMEVLEYV